MAPVCCSCFTRPQLIYPVYPIRTTITGHLTFDTSIIQRHNHPGYFVDTPAAAGEYPLETYSPDHEYHTLHRNLREDFARGMRDAEICVFDASLERKMIRKVDRLSQSASTS